METLMPAVSGAKLFEYSMFSLESDSRSSSKDTICVVITPYNAANIVHPVPIHQASK